LKKKQEEGSAIELITTTNISQQICKTMKDDVVRKIKLQKILFLPFYFFNFHFLPENRATNSFQAFLSVSF